MNRMIRSSPGLLGKGAPASEASGVAGRIPPARKGWSPSLLGEGAPASEASGVGGRIPPARPHAPEGWWVGPIPLPPGLQAGRNLPPPQWGTFPDPPTSGTVRRLRGGGS
jgi:hypothetical protein